jgi:hypothetical protein
VSPNWTAEFVVKPTGAEEHLQDGREVWADQVQRSAHHRGGVNKVTNMMGELMSDRLEMAMLNRAHPSDAMFLMPKRLNR